MIDFLISDDELIYMIKQNNKEAYGLLFSRYEKNMGSMLKKIENYLYSNIDESTVFSIYMESFDKSVKLYNNAKGAFFYFMKEIFRFDLVKFYRNNLSSYDKEILSFDDKDNYIKDTFMDDNDYHKKVEVILILEKLKEENELDYQVVKYWMYGYRYKEISKILNLGVKQIYYILDRSFKRIKNLFEID